jgi:hypothetical protein
MTLAGSSDTLPFFVETVEVLEDDSTSCLWRKRNSVLSKKCGLEYPLINVDEHWPV